MMKLLLTEHLTSPILSCHGRLIAAADCCWTLRTDHGSDALAVLGDTRWQKGSVPLIESAEGRLSAWTGRLMQGLDEPFNHTERALLAYGVETRLWSSAVADGLVRHTSEATGRPLDDVELDLITDDPYMRDAFTRPDGLRARLKAVQMHGTRAGRPAWKRWRERIAADSRLRSLALGAQCRVKRWFRRQQLSEPLGRGVRRAALFVLNQRFLDLFAPVAVELEKRGWQVRVFYYHSSMTPGRHRHAFSDSADASGFSMASLSPSPSWTISDGLLRHSLVSEAGLRLALAASWVTARAQIGLHHSVLDAWRPEVVISFGPETMSLALQRAAERLGIPSLFMAHGFQGPVRTSWFFHATASALSGAACVQANERDANGERRKGLVATGHPPYDAMLSESVAHAGRRVPLPGLDVPLARPHLVLAFALWSHNLLGHALQAKILRMLTKALPDDAFLVYKLHPSREERRICEAVLESGLPREAFRVVGEKEYSTPVLLAACHVAVANEQSMVLTDAIVMGRPAIVITHPDFPRGSGTLNHPASDFRDTCVLVSDAVELRNALVLLTHNEEERQALVNHRAEYIRRFLVAADGRAGRRVADLVEHLGAGQSPDSAVMTIGDSLLAS